MKKQSIIYFLLIVQLSSIIFFAKNHQPQNKNILFHNDEIVFSLYESPWKIVVSSSDGSIIFGYSEPISFKINDKWESIEKTLLIKNVSEREVSLVLELTNKDTVNFNIVHNSQSFFRMEITSTIKNIMAVKGTNSLQAVEEVYGFGEMWNGSVAQRGKSFDIWDVSGTPDECAYMPYYVSTQNYSFWFEYGGAVHFDVGKNNVNELRWEFSSNKIIMNLFIGNSLAEAVQGFVKNTGELLNPPRWAYKPWAWLMHDPDKPGASIATLKGKHAIKMAEKFNELNIPIGVTWMEPPWQTERTSFIANKEFDSDITKTISTLNKMGVKTLAWTVPYTTKDSPNWDEAVNNNYIVGMPNEKKTSGVIEITRTGEIGGKTYNYIDYINPSAVIWWQKEIEKAISLGFAGFKLDAGQNLEKDALLYQNRVGKDWHNSYAHYYNKTFYEILNKKLGRDFLMIPRAAFIGTGKYTNFKWPGDLTATFGKNGLPASIFSTLSASLSGLPFLATDIGGFNGRPAPESVWIRWSQFGAMLPGMETLNMPWWYSEKAQDHYRFLSWLHTDLIPYWQTLGNEAAKNGTPLCRHLVWDYQDDIETWRIDDEFTIGENILVAPILESNAIRKVYLPKGRWYDFWDDSNIYEGGNWIKYFKGWKDNLYKFPLYIREGAIIPLAVENEISGFGWKESKDFVTMAIWPIENGVSSFELWDLEKPVLFEVKGGDKEIEIKWGKSKKNYLFRINCNKNTLPSEIVVKVSKDNTIPKFNTLKEFLNSKLDGWIYLPKKNKVIVSKYNNEKSGIINVFFSKNNNK